MSQEGSINDRDFGLVIAYLLPGFTALWALTYLTDALDPWFGQLPASPPTVGGFLYMTVASIGAGITVSTVRWLVIDSLHRWTGLRPPQWDFSLLRDSVAAFGMIVDHQYRYYQFYGNSLVSLGAVFIARRWSLGFWTSWSAVDCGLIVLMIVFFLGSRDTLRRYYVRAGQLLHKEKSRRAEE